LRPFPSPTISPFVVRGKNEPISTADATINCVYSRLPCRISLVLELPSTVLRSKYV
jgi:hypothetical protein